MEKQLEDKVCVPKFIINKEQQDAIVTLYVENQMPIEEIMRLKNHSRETVKKVLLSRKIEIKHFKDFTQTRLSEDDKNKIVDLYHKKKKSVAFVCRLFHIRRERLVVIINDAGFKMRTQGESRRCEIPENIKEKIVELYQTSGVKTIAKTLKLSNGAIKRFLCEKKLIGSRHLGNSNRGANCSDFFSLWERTLGKDAAQKRYQEYIKRLSKSSSGKNNSMYGKPAPKGSGNGWKCWYKDVFFRSLRELSYFINEIEAKNIQWESAEKRKYRINYEFMGVSRTYSPDFFLIDSKTLVEIKPIRLHTSPLILAKKEAAERFCQEKDYTYLITDISVDFEQIKRLYLAGQITPQERYKQRFEEKLGVPIPS